MLTVPMLSAMDEVIGVIQLINKKRDPGKPLALAHFDRDVIPFDQRAEELAPAWRRRPASRSRTRSSTRRSASCSTGSSRPR